MPGVKIGLGVACLGLVAACQTTAGEQAKIVSGSADGVQVLASYNSQQVRPLAQAYCRQHGKRAVIRGAIPASGDTVLTGWVVGTKPYIFEFDCI